jgi:hypothetical protein
MFNREEVVPLDCSGDEQRIVKLADIELRKCTSGWPFKSVHYYAIHKPTGLTNTRYEDYANKNPDWAVADCIRMVLEYGTQAGDGWRRVEGAT